jgi:hypothetical protein
VGRKAVVPLDRSGHVAEVAALVAFIAGPESSYITGANPAVDPCTTKHDAVEAMLAGAVALLPDARNPVVGMVIG